MLQFCGDELSGLDNRQVQWRCYALEETRSKNGKTLKKLTLVYKNTSSSEFIKYLKPKFQHFIKHNFVARWQNKKFKTCVKSFSNDCIVFIVDFVKHYTFQIQNEVQSMYWHSYHISILVHILYYLNLNYDPYDEDSRVLTKYQFYVSNDQKHDSEFVQHYFQLHWKHISHQGLKPT
jgi:hypothetical protein